MNPKRLGGGLLTKTPDSTMADNVSTLISKLKSFSFKAELRSDLLLAGILNDKSASNLNAVDPVIPKLRIKNSLFNSRKGPSESLIPQTSSIAQSPSTSVSPYAPILADPGISKPIVVPRVVPEPILANPKVVKSEISAPFQQEYVEYGDVDFKDNHLLNHFQPNVEDMAGKKSAHDGILNVSWTDDEEVVSMEDSLFLRCHQFLKDEANFGDEENFDEDKKCELDNIPRWRQVSRGGLRGKNGRSRRDREVGRICLRRTQDGEFEIKKEVKEEQPANSHYNLTFGVDNCDFCPACQVHIYNLKGKKQLPQIYVYQDHLRPSLVSLVVNVAEGKLQTRCGSCFSDISIAGLIPPVLPVN